MKILIVGSGVAGLTAYLLLKKHLFGNNEHNIDISIIDAYSVHTSEIADIIPNAPSRSEEPVIIPAATGNILGITINGLKVLSRLDGDGAILQKLRQRGHVVDLWKMSDARGWLNIEFSMRSTTKEAQFASRGDDSHGIDFSSLIIARQDLWEVLRDAALEAGAVIDQKKVVRIETGESTHEATATTDVNVHYADGTSVAADLVIGADGLRSMVRKTMFGGGGNKTRRSQVDNWVSWLNPLKSKSKSVDEEVDYVTPHYEGLVGIGGFIPSSVLIDAGHQPAKMSIVFGPNGFFGHGYNTTDPTDPSKPGPTAAWWSTFASTSPAPYKSKVDNNNSSNGSNSVDGSGGDHSGDSSDSHRNFNKDQALQGLLSRQRWWKNPVIQAILDHVEKNGVEQFYPTYTTPQLPTWQEKGQLVLIGDAAHTLQPSSGQGASQAMEDAEALALLLKHHLYSSSTKNKTNNVNPKDAIKYALDKYVQMRRPRVMKIYERSQQMSRMKSDLNLWQEMMMLTFLWVLSFKKKDRFNDELFGYDLPSDVERVIGQD